MRIFTSFDLNYILIEFLHFVLGSYQLFSNLSASSFPGIEVVLFYYNSKLWFPFKKFQRIKHKWQSNFFCQRTFLSKASLNFINNLTYQCQSMLFIIIFNHITLLLERSDYIDYKMSPVNIFNKEQA